MTNVIEFRKRPTYPGDAEPLEPDVTIFIYERPDKNGFDWIVTDEGVSLSKETLSDYLGDMFLSLNPDEEPPSIFQRARAFFRTLFHKGV